MSQRMSALMIPTSSESAKEKDEDRYEGFSGKARREGEAEELANVCEAILRLEGRIQGSAGEAYAGPERDSAASLRGEQVCAAAGLSGHGCGGQGWRDPACDVGGESAGLRGVEFQAAERRGTGARFSVARGAEAAGARADRHLQPVVLRGSAGAAGASGDSGGRGSCRYAGR